MTEERASNIHHVQKEDMTLSHTTHINHQTNKLGPLRFAAAASLCMVNKNHAAAAAAASPGRLRVISLKAIDNG